MDVSVEAYVDELPVDPSYYRAAKAAKEGD